MTNAIQPHLFGDEESDAPHYASFILRCWTGKGGKVRVRLIDVHSGVSRPVTDLADLPGLVRRLVAEGAPDQEDTR